MGVLSVPLNPIRMLGTQARSYAGSVASSGIRTARQITKNALGHGLSNYAIGGAIVGAGAGGYDGYESRTGTVGGALKGAAYGAAAGVGLRMGMSAMNASGRRSIGALGKRLGGGVGGAGRQAAQGSNYLRNMNSMIQWNGGYGATAGAMAGDAYKAAGRGMNSLRNSSGLDAARAKGLHLYGRGVHQATRLGKLGSALARHSQTADYLRYQAGLGAQAPLGDVASALGGRAKSAVSSAYGRFKGFMSDLNKPE